DVDLPVAVVVDQRDAAHRGLHRVVEHAVRQLVAEREAARLRDLGELRMARDELLAARGDDKQRREEGGARGRHFAARISTGVPEPSWTSAAAETVVAASTAISTRYCPAATPFSVTLPLASVWFDDDEKMFCSVSPLSTRRPVAS